MKTEMPGLDTQIATQSLRTFTGSSNSPALAQDKPSMRLDVLGSLRRHRLLSITSFLLALVCGLGVAWVRGKPKYSAAAVIFVSPRFVANLQDDKEFDLQSNSQYREYVQQNVRTINRFDIVREAIENLGPKQSLWVRPKESMTRATERLQGTLTIEPVPDTYQILVSLSGGKPNGLATIVNAVVNTFLLKIKTEEFYGSDDRLRNLRDERARLQKDVAEKQQQRATLAQELGVSTFAEGILNPYDKLLVDQKGALADARRDRIQAEAQLAAVEMPGSGKGPNPLQAYALEMVSKDPGLTTLDANLNQRRSVLLANISGLAPDHPGRRAAEKELQELEADRDRAYNSRLKSYMAMILEQKKAEVGKTRQVEKGLTQEVAIQAGQASGFSHGYQEAMGLGQEMDRERKRVDSIEDRISFLSLESRAPGFVRLFSAARPPEFPVKGGRKRLALVSLVAALLLGILIPVTVDYLDPRLHWPGDLQQALGFPVLGWLLEKAEAGKDFEREQVFRIASRISQEFQTHGSQIFAFTGVKAGNGTTTVVHNVAHALTQLGIPALAVEANAYRADPRYRSPNSRGLTVVLRGQSDIAAEIVPGDDEKPDHLPVGDINTLGNLPDLQNLVQVLKQATSVYSIILVDLPPILASVDSELIARSADVVVLVVEAETVSKGEAKRAAKVLTRVNPSAIATLLNRVRLDSAAGFGREARDEFYQGTTKPASFWTSPWLWR